MAQQAQTPGLQHRQGLVTQVGGIELGLVTQVGGIELGLSGGSVIRQVAALAASRMRNCAVGAGMGNIPRFA